MVHFDIQLGKAWKVLKCNRPVLMSVDVNEVYSDGEAIFQPLDGPDEINMLCVLVGLQPISRGAFDATQVVTANGNSSVRDVAEGADCVHGQEGSVNPVKFGTVWVNLAF